MFNMKCQECLKRMKTQCGETDINVGGTKIRVVNMPVLVCPECGRRVIQDTIIRRAEGYVTQYGTVDGVLDFKEYEEKEAEELMLIINMLNLM